MISLDKYVVIYLLDGMSHLVCLFYVLCTFGIALIYPKVNMMFKQKVNLKVFVNCPLYGDEDNRGTEIRHGLCPGGSWNVFNF